MNTSDIFRILNNEKDWLVDQPGMQPRDKGCRRVVAMLETRLVQYSKLVRESKTGPAGSDASILARRLGRHAEAPRWGLKNGGQP